MKYLIIGPSAQEQDRLSIIHKITEIDSATTVANTFTTDTAFTQNKDANDSYKYRINPTDIDISFKNAAATYCVDTSAEAHGIMADDYTMCDTAQCSFEDFNYIYNTYIEDTDVIIWVDRENDKSKHAFNADTRISESNIPCMRFNTREDTPDKIAHVILEYIAADDNARSVIIYNNS